LAWRYRVAEAVLVRLILETKKMRPEVPIVQCGDSVGSQKVQATVRPFPEGAQ
jgi:hypothetical protein